MTILTVSQNNTFGQWLSVTNQLVALTNQLIEGAVTVNGTIYLANSGFSLTIQGSANIANNLIMTAAGGNTVFLQSSNAVVNGTIYATGPGTSLSVSNTATANNILTNYLTVNTIEVVGNVISSSVVNSGNTNTGNLTATNSVTAANLNISNNTSLGNLTVTGTTILLGNVTELATVNVSNTLIVGGNATVGATLTTQNLIATLSTSTGNLSVTGPASVTGNFYANNTTANNNSTVLGSMNVVGSSFDQNHTTNNVIIALGSIATNGNVTCNNVTANGSVNMVGDLVTTGNIWNTGNTFLGGQAYPASIQAIRADQVFQVMQPNPIIVTGGTGLIVNLPPLNVFTRYEIWLENITVTVSGAVVEIQASNGSTIIQTGYTSTFFGYATTAGFTSGSLTSLTGHQLMQAQPINPPAPAYSKTKFSLTNTLGAVDPQWVTESWGYNSALQFSHYHWHGIVGAPAGFGYTSAFRFVATQSSQWSGQISIYGSP